MTEVQNRTISGSGRRDILSGDGGDDTIFGRNGHDDLNGGAGNDALNGGNGRDTLFGGEGDDTLIGGNGNDRFVIDGDLAGQSFDTIMDFDIGRDLRSMTFTDTLELRNVGEQDVRFVQNGEDVDLFIGGNLMAVFKGSQGLLLAADLLAASTVVGDAPASIEVGGGVQESLFDAIVIKGIDQGDRSGWSVSSAGDVDGDGLADVIIGAPRASPNGQFNAGESYLVFGSALVASDGEINLATLAEDGNGVVIEGVGFFDTFGSSVSSAGDVDGDGLSDIIVGDNAFDFETFISGQSYIIFGSALAASDGEINLSTLAADGNGFVISGVQSGDSSVSFVGDIDGDGKNDILIGAPNASASTDRENSTTGQTFLVFSSALSASGGEIDLSTLAEDGNGVVINGFNAFASSGQSVSSAGDFDGDGVADIIIGAPNTDVGEAFASGESYVVFGSALRDSNGEIDLATLVEDGNGVVIRGVRQNDNSGLAVSGAGDVNGDGFDDVLVGSIFAGTGNEGAGYLVFGSARADGASEINLATLGDDGNGVKITGIDPSDFNGAALSGIGDLDGDGKDDILISAYLGDRESAADVGEAYVVFGEALDAADGELDLATLVADGNGVVIRGLDAGDYFGFSVSSAGDVDGDGLNDLIIGAPGDGFTDENFAGESYVISGALLLEEATIGDGVIELGDLFII